MRARSNLYTPDELEPAYNIIMPLVENAGAGSQVVFVSDQDGAAIKGMIASDASGTVISDISREDGLWSLLKEK